MKKVAHFKEVATHSAHGQMQVIGRRLKMQPLPYIYPYALIFWPVYGLIFFQEWKVLSGRKPRAGEIENQDRGSFSLIYRGIQFAAVIAFICAGTLPFALIRNGQVAYFWAGIFFMVAGAIFRRHCFKTLGEHFRPAVTVVPNQPIIERGAYKWVRHPSYLAAILMFLGIGLALANWISIAVVVLIPAAAYGYRIYVEEQALLETLGTPYREYMNRTKRLIPFLF
jgi:protein-S-isoprenylcysteine O-methyltransferase Ste14